MLVAVAGVGMYSCIQIQWVFGTNCAVLESRVMITCLTANHPFTVDISGCVNPS